MVAIVSVGRDCSFVKCFVHHTHTSIVVTPRRSSDALVRSRGCDLWLRSLVDGERKEEERRGRKEVRRVEEEEVMFLQCEAPIERVCLLRCVDHGDKTGSFSGEIASVVDS